jgi:hypothetical protein
MGSVSAGGGRPAAIYSSASLNVNEGNGLTHPCFSLDFPLTVLRLALSHSHFFDFSLDGSLGCDCFELLTELCDKIRLDFRVSVNETV